MFEIKINRSLIIFFLIILLILTVGVVSANENINDTEIISEDNNVLTYDNEIGEDSLESIDENTISVDSFEGTDENTIAEEDSDVNEVHSSSIELSKQSITGKTKSTTSITVNVKDENGNNLNTGFVSLDVDDVTYESDVVDGKAKITFKMPKYSGTSKYKINYYSLSPNIKDSSKTIVLTSKIGTKIIVKSFTGYQGKKVKLYVTLKTDSNKPVKGVYVKFKFNGKNYSVKTNSKGKAVISVKYPKTKFYKTVKKTKGKILTKTSYYKKVYVCKVSFNGKNNYLKSSSSFKVTSKKKPIVKKYKKYNYKYFTVPLKYGQHKYEKGSYGIVTVKYEDTYSDYIVVALVDIKAKKVLKISTKLHCKHPYDGKWSWDSSWEPSQEYDNMEMVLYEHSKNFPSNKVKISYYCPHYKLIK